MGTPAITNGVVRAEPGNKARLMKWVKFTFDGVGTGTVVTDFSIAGILIGWRKTGGDASWRARLSDGGTYLTGPIIFNQLITTAAGPLYLSDGGANHLGIPIVNTLGFTVSLAGGTAGTFTVFYQEE